MPFDNEQMLEELKMLYKGEPITRPVASRKDLATLMSHPLLMLLDKPTGTKSGDILVSKMTNLMYDEVRTEWSNAAEITLFAMALQIVKHSPLPPEVKIRAIEQALKPVQDPFHGLSTNPINN